MKPNYQNINLNGCIRDNKDSRDFLFKHLETTQELPPSKDLRYLNSPVENQYSLGSCTANALVGGLEYLTNHSNPLAYEDLSRLFVYYNERVLMDTVNEDSGASLRDGCKVLTELGVCSEKLWPYDISKFTTKPTDECFSDAMNHQLLSYWRIESGNLEQMKQCLAEGYPFVFGFKVMPNFYSIGSNGNMRNPRCYESLMKLGGHAVLACGYSDLRKVVIVKNSWGEDFGEDGYFYMPYKFIANKLWCWDFWTLRSYEL